MATILPPAEPATDEALIEAAQETDLPTADNGGERVLPFSFAKRNGLFVQGYAE